MKSFYLCNVFFIVLDLRLTRLGLGGAPFFLPFIEKYVKLWPINPMYC